MNIMISGALGLVGSDLIRPLLEENHKIIAIYRSKNKARKNISHKNLIWKKVDLKHRISLKRRVDIILHCAVAHPFSKKNKIDHYVSSNVLSLTNLVDFAKRSKTKMIINFSSLKIYGKINIKRLNEEYIPLKQDLLGLTKYLSEKYLFEQPVNFINLRFPGVLCSTKNNPRPWLQTLINKIKNNNEVKVHNINSYFNNAIDTKEIARFILMIIKKRKNIRDTFNLSASKPLKLKSIIDIIKTKYHSKSKIKNIEKKNKSFVLSINKIKKKLNFHPVSTKKIIMRNL